MILLLLLRSIQHRILCMLGVGPGSSSGFFLCTMFYLYCHNYSLSSNISLSLILSCLQNLCWNGRICGFIPLFILSIPALGSLNASCPGPGPCTTLFPCPPSPQEFAFSCLLLKSLPFTPYQTTSPIDNTL